MKTEKGLIKLVISSFMMPMAVAAALLMPAESAFAATLDVDVRPENRTVLLPGPGNGNILIRITAPQGLPVDDRPPLNLCLVLDKSGSMGDSGKIDFALKAAHSLVDRLGPGDMLSIVTYDQRVRTVVRAMPVNNREKLHRIIDKIQAGGRTFLSGGLEEGFRQAKRGKRRGYINRILLLSDGLANVGITDRDTLRRRTSAMSESGVSVSTFGMGLDFDERLLATMANGGGGSYHYLARSRDIVTALRNEFNMAAATVATGVEIIIKPLNDSRLGDVSGYGWSREGNSIVIGVGDVSAGEQRSLMASLNVQNQRPGDLSVADVSIRYRDPSTGRIVTRKSGTVSLEVVGELETYNKGFDNEVLEKNSIIKSNVKMEEASDLVETGDRDGALKVLKDAARALTSAPATPETASELRENETYQDEIGRMDEMDDLEQKEMQKGVRYRSYKKLYQQ